MRTILSRQNTELASGDTRPPASNRGPEPWEMTYEALFAAASTGNPLEIRRPVLILMRDYMRGENPSELSGWEQTRGDIDAELAGGPTVPIPTVELSRAHRKVILDALAEDKPVPLDVLKDYPDLASEHCCNRNTPGSEVDTYFDTTSTGMSFYDGILKNPAYYEAAKGKVGRVVLMSPDEYIRQAAKVREVPATYEKELRSVEHQLVREYVERVRKGEKMPLLLLDTTIQTQEGRHRAVAAKRLGLTKVPVLVVKKGREPWQIPLGEYGAAKWQHEYIVKQALSERKPVPAKVLNDYPDLAAAVSTRTGQKKTMP